MTITPNSLKRPDWLMIWAGGWSVLSCSHFGEQYTRLIKFGGRPFASEQVMFIRHGKSQGWARQRDRERVYKYLARQVAHNQRQVIAICHDLKRQTDIMLDFIKTNKGKEINELLYRKFWTKLTRYYYTHTKVKYIVDGLSIERLKKMLPYFQEVRLYEEPVFKRSEDFLVAMARRIGKKLSLTPELVLCAIQEEMIEYFRTGKFPPKSTLVKRHQFFGVYFNRRRAAYYIGQSAQAVEKVITSAQKRAVIKGVSAQAGEVTGTARIVHDPHKVKIFNFGDVLITGMTRPEFLPLIKKSAAFVTDAGGILSHAAIMARELKKPCVIGTRIATKIFKDGDLVKVDATKGIVKKIQ